MYTSVCRWVVRGSLCHILFSKITQCASNNIPSSPLLNDNILLNTNYIKAQVRNFWILFFSKINNQRQEHLDHPYKMLIFNFIFMQMKLKILILYIYLLYIYL